MPVGAWARPTHRSSGSRSAGQISSQTESAHRPRTLAARDQAADAERTGTAFTDLQHPTDVVLHCVSWRLRYKLSFRDAAEMLVQRRFEVTHETVRA